ncbi:hypothetical protein V6N13_110344 [Hibiscus sabdariffa]
MTRGLLRGLALPFGCGFVQPWAHGLLCGLALPFGCGFVQPWARGARLCVANLIGSMSLGGSRTQGCDAKAPCVGWCMPLAPMALGVLVLAMTGASWPNCGLPSPLLGDDQKLQYGAWLRAPQPKRPAVARPRGCVSNVKDADLPPLSPVPLVASSPPNSVSTVAASVPAPAATDAAASVPASAASVGPATSVAPLAPGCDATVSAPLPAHSTRDNVHVACDNEAPYDPMLHRDVSDAMEDSLDVLNGCTLFSDLDGMVQSAGLDNVVDEAADALIRDVASSILGQVSASSATPATVVSTVAACSSPLPPASRPTSTCARRLSMPPVPEQDDFKAWYAAQVHAASQAPPPQPLTVGFSSRPAPPRPNKRAASHTDPSRAKRSRPATRTSQAGMSSSNNSSVEAVRQPYVDQ